MDRVDVVAIAALPEEFDAARAAGLAIAPAGPGVLRWEERHPDGVPPFLRGEYRADGKACFTVALARPTQMGGRATGPFAASLVDRLRPALLAMCGICAGNPGDTALGDVVVGEPVYQWDEGKQSASGFEGDHRQFRLEPRWLRAAQDFYPGGLPSHGDASDDEALLWFLEQLHRGRQPRDHPARDAYFPRGTWQRRLSHLEQQGLIRRDPTGGAFLTSDGSSLVRRRLYDDVDGPRQLPFRVLAAPMASGTAVIADPDVWGRLKAMGMRKIAAVEMEAATIATVAHDRGLAWLVAKGVTDHAETRTDDRYKQFAARASAQVMFALLERMLARTDTDTPRATARDSGAQRAEPAPVERAPVGSARTAAENEARAVTVSLLKVDKRSHGSTELVQRAHELVGSHHLLGADLAAELRRGIARYYERIGDTASAAGEWNKILGVGRASIEDLICAALAYVANGEYLRAHDTLDSATDLDLQTGTGNRAWWARAAALDGLGKLKAADPLWAALADRRWQFDGEERIAFEIARARARFLRGDLPAAKRILTPLTRLTTDARSSIGDRMNEACVEQARVMLLAGDARNAYRIALRSVAHYRDRGEVASTRCMRAELVEAEAAVALDWSSLSAHASRAARDAEQTLARISERLPTVAGPHSTFCLSALVAYGAYLARTGREEAAYAVLSPALDRIRGWLGVHHPLYLRAQCAAGVSHLRLGEYADAAALLGEAWVGQRDLLGPGHPDTLITQLEYILALRARDRHRSIELFEDLWGRLPGGTSRFGELYMRAFAMRGLLGISSAPVLTATVKLSKLIDRFSGR